MKTILVPTDFSTTADNAMWYAAGLSECASYNKLILMHANDAPIVKTPENIVEPDKGFALEDFFKFKLQTLARQVQTWAGNMLEVETICVDGTFSESLLNTVQSKEVDLVVMGTKGAHNILDKIIGNNTANCIKQSQCPVLVVPPDVTYRDIKHIAYASDYEREDFPFLIQLFAFSDNLNADICIFNVKSNDQLDLVSDEPLLREISRNFPDKKLSFAQLKEDHIVTGIETFVLENKMDLLALPVYPMDLIEKLFHTSVSQQLTFHSKIPFLAIPQKPYSKSKASGKGTKSLKNRLHY